ncbi:MAG: aconitase family protein, partial [Rhodospirillales bacterium]|nr:aconitase family protein [Rhodospirillales bacterium]
LIAAGLLARKTNEFGFTRKPWVKTSLAPGSKVVTEYLEKSKLLDDLEALGFHLVGYGCTTCIGNSGPLPEPISKAIHEGDIVAASVLSGNRNFEGRVNPDVRANYLASPPLCVAYAIAGTVNINLQSDAIGTDENGKDVYLTDIWPSQDEILDLVRQNVTREQFIEQYASVFEGSDEWRSIDAPSGSLYAWDEKSTYVQEPPFFVDMSESAQPIKPIAGGRCLVKAGDSVTTDHISTAGAIKVASPAGQYLIDNGVPVSMFNSYGSRRGNDQVMTRGTFANIRVRNQLAPDTEGGYTTDFTLEPFDTGEDVGDPAIGKEGLDGGAINYIYNAAMNYKQQGTPLVVLAGKDYGMGSSRDWAAKGTYLLGIRAVIAESFERIHRSNLIGMGVLPLEFKPGTDRKSLGLDGSEIVDITRVEDGIT